MPTEAELFPECRYSERFRERVPDRFCSEPTIGGGGVKTPEQCAACPIPALMGGGKRATAPRPKSLARAKPPKTASVWCGGCARRQAKLNQIVPGLGDGVAWVIEKSGAGKLFGKTADDDLP